MRVLENVDDGKIRHDVQRGQQREGRAHEQKLRQRGRARHFHQRNIAAPRADDRHDRLDQRQTKRKHQGVMAGLCDHLAAPCPGLAP
jgi:hypothetical protein